MCWCVYINKFGVAVVKGIILLSIWFENRCRDYNCRMLQTILFAHIQSLIDLIIKLTTEECLAEEIDYEYVEYYNQSMLIIH